MLLSNYLNRRSSRSFYRKKISINDIHKIIKIAQIAPNACNLQTYFFVYVDDPLILNDLAKNVTGKINWAPGLIIALNDGRFLSKRSSGIQSLSASIQLMLLAAQDLGLGTCWMAGFDNDNYLRKKLNIPSYFEVTAIIGIGYPKKEGKKVRFIKDISEIFSYNKYNPSHGGDFEYRDIKKWSDEQLTSYRKRISSVYGHKQAIQAFPDHFYKEAAEYLRVRIKLNLLSKKTILDIFSYDATFSSYLSKAINIKNIFISDYSLFFMDFLKFKNKLLINDLIKSNKKFDITTIVYKLEFTLRPEDLIEKARLLTKKNGYLFIAFVSPISLNQFIKMIFSFCLKTNVYENNGHYRIGPYSYRTLNTVRKIIKSYDFEIVDIRRVSFIFSNFFILAKKIK